jgi:hypothetical protein
MSDAEYISRLHHQLVAYKSSVLGVSESGVWGSPPKAYPHILPAASAELNIVAPLRERFRIERGRHRWKLHKYFHHLSSSQALAFNLFFPIFPSIPLRMAATRRTLGLPSGAPCDLRFEAILDPKEGTNIDALVSAADGRRTVIEVKLTERTFGTAPADDRHLRKLNEIYRPRLAGRIADSCLEPATFFRDYQLFRNLTQVRPGTADRVVLLLPRARTQLWRHATSWSSSERLGSLRECVSVVALEDVVAALATDTAGSEDDSRAIAEVARKYVLAAG